MNKRIITLTTDFGTADYYTGAMKGVILRIQPSAQIVDISHNIQPFEISDGAFTVAQACPYYPKKTIHVVVVDPGVGTDRRPILAQIDGQYYIAPDNGVLSMIFAGAERKALVRHLTNSRYFLKPVSRTFHGRDVFAPVAAQLASGIPPARFGPRIKDYLRLNFERPTRVGKLAWTGRILKVDRFGNLITNLHVHEMAGVNTRPFELKVGAQVIERLALTFTECAAGELFVVVGSSGYLEVATNQGSAASLLGSGAGAPVELTIF